MTTPSAPAPDWMGRISPELAIETVAILMFLDQRASDLTDLLKLKFAGSIFTGISPKNIRVDDPKFGCSNSKPPEAYFTIQISRGKPGEAGAKGAVPVLFLRITPQVGGEPGRVELNFGSPPGQIGGDNSSAIKEWQWFSASLDMTEMTAEWNHLVATIRADFYIIHAAFQSLIPETIH